MAATTTAPAGQGDYLTAEEAANILRISRQTLGVLYRSGALNYYRFGKVVRILRSDLEAYRAASLAKPDLIQPPAAAPVA